MNIASHSTDLYATYEARMRKIADVKNALAVLQWDQETYLPKKGASFRGQQIASLSEIAHQLFTEKDLGELIEELLQRDDFSERQRRNLELSMEDYNRQKKFSSEFVRTLSEAISRSFHAWIAAREKNAFGFFEKELSGLIALKQQEADIVGYSGHPYNALLDEFEKGCTVALLDPLFDKIRGPLKDLLDHITNSPQVDDSFLHQHFPGAQQWDFGMGMIKDLGFDFDAGRQDISEHPFTTSFNKNDVRLTTRIDENDFSNMLWGCIHETGHGLYEQGLPESEYGLPLGEYASLGIHESQSRLWENNVGRSLAFWQCHYPSLQQAFPGQFKEVPISTFYGGINKVQPSLIRTEADEVTYHFHVMIRYELEKKLIEGSLASRDIPAYWNAQYEKYMGLKITNDKAGCLQDIHWSHGSFGYFATYSLGSFYAAQFFATIEKSTPGLANQVKNGDTSLILNWLRQNIHQYGRMYKSEELCKKVCGETLDISYFMAYLLDKYRNIYNF